MAPAARAAWQDDAFLLKATAGRAHPPSNAFLNSMTGPGIMLAAATHWLVACLAHRLDKVARGGTEYQVSIRLTIYIFLPWMVMDATADLLSLPFYPLPSAIAKFIWRLVKVGMPRDKVDNEQAARALVGEYALKLNSDKRTFDASSFVQITAAHDNFITSITPAMPRSTGASNQELADLLCSGAKPTSRARIRGRGVDWGDPALFCRLSPMPVLMIGYTMNGCCVPNP
jgi:hypothetical protein